MDTAIVELESAEDVQRSALALKVFAMMADGVGKLEACERAGVPYSTFRDWERNRRLREALQVYGRELARRSQVVVAKQVGKFYDRLDEIVDDAIDIATNPDYAPRDRTNSKRWLVEFVADWSPPSGALDKGSEERAHLARYKQSAEPITVRTTIVKNPDGTRSIISHRPEDDKSEQG